MDGLAGRSHHGLVKTAEAQFDERYMGMAVEAAEAVAGRTSPNPWVGAVLVSDGGEVFVSATAPHGGPHAEARVLSVAGDRARDATLYCTLEPCVHVGRNPPCLDAIVEAGVNRVVVGITDPDRRVDGRGVAGLSAAGVSVTQGVLAGSIEAQLAPYLKHRETGLPYVVLKMGTTLDGRTAAPDYSSRWITGDEAREDVQRLRARCDAIVVGARTVSTDNPSLTVRLPDFAAAEQPLRVVLGPASAEAKVQPALSWSDSLEALLEELGRRGCLQVLVEGGATVAGEFHRRRLVDRYRFYISPKLMGGSDGRPVLDGPGAASMAEIWTGRLLDVTRLGDDLRVELEPVVRDQVHDEENEETG